MKTLSATYKGLVTGLLMVAISLVIYYLQKGFDSNLRYITYATYTVGIYWTLSSYSNMPGVIKTFRSFFSQGFRCFIVVTLMMVSFTYILIKSDPSFEAEMAENQRIGLEEKGNLTPDEQVLFLTDIFPTGWSAVKWAKVTPVDTVAISEADLLALWPRNLHG